MGSSAPFSYSARYGGGTGIFVMHFHSIAEMTSWVEFNGLKMGTGGDEIGWFEPAHIDGSPLSGDELEAMSQLAPFRVLRQAGEEE